jgi:hypothetical protein
VRKDPHAREAALDYEWYDVSMSLAVERAQRMETGFKGTTRMRFFL